MGYAKWEWHRPDDRWKDDGPAPATPETRQRKIKAAVSKLLSGVLLEFGPGVTVDFRLEHVAIESPVFHLLGVSRRQG